ncbi:alpha/beta fold hydrolase [Microbacteriaceae bacterium 4G12]
MPILDVNGTSLYYTVKGEGVPIVLIHPPVLNHESFYYQIQELSKVFQVIAFDIRGHGKSQYSRQPITYSLIARDIKYLLDYLEIEKAFICGYSTGGSIVLEFLLAYAEKSLGGIVISGMSEVRDRRLRKKIYLGMALAKIKAISALALSVSQGNSNTWKLFMKVFWAARKANARNVEQYYRYSLHYNCTEQLGNISLPVLLVYGKDDTMFFDYAKLLHEKLPYNELTFIDKIQHQIPSKAAVKLNDLIKDFIHSKGFSHD